MYVRIVALALCAVVPSVATRAEEPLHVYLTWQNDTSTTMTVNFQTAQKIDASRVYYDSQPRSGDVKAYALSKEGSAHQIPELADGRWVHVVELTGLLPNTVYYFVAGDGQGTISKEFSFQTIPSGDEPIRFITGGDMDVVKGARDILAVTGQRTPMFVAVGGDIAYNNDDVKAFGKWDRWISNWNEFLTSPEGRMTPMVLGIGNHEVAGGYGKPKENARFYFGYFAQGGESYFARRFGKNLLLCALDSGHIASHESQAGWLDGTLAENPVAHTMALYHVPLYPSHRDFMGEGMVAGRTHWAPIFDKHHLDVAFENHDHTFKRTPRIKANRINPEGTLYLGDGCFGVIPREVDAERRWYEEVASSTPHFWLVTATREVITFEAVGKDGQIFDSISLP